jgi:hypothetical protein
MFYDYESSKSVTSGSTETLFTFQVPENNILVFRKFGNDLSDVAGWGNVSFSIQKNGIGIDPYDNIKDQIGYLSMPKDISAIKINPFDILEIKITNNYSATLKAGIVFQYDLLEI